MSYNGAGVYTLYPTGNPVVTGTIISSAWANGTLNDIVTALSTAMLKDGQQVVTGNIPLANFRITGLGAATALTDAIQASQVQNSSVVTLGTVAGTNTITAVAAPVPSAYAAGQVFRFIPANTNTGATTMNISSLGAKNIYWKGAALGGGEILINVPSEIYYDGTQFNLLTGRGDFSSNTATSVDDELVLFSGTGGKTGKRATATGIAKLTSGVLSAATAGTDYAGLASLNTFTNAQNLARATVASHATTADIWGAAGNQINWTGTETTTAFPNAPQAGAERVLICAGASSFTAGANMLIDGVASGNTVTCAANDQVIVRAVSTTQFKLSRIKYDGTAQVASNGLKLLSTVTASASATVDIETTFDSTYKTYLIACTDVIISATAIINIRFKTAGAYVSTNTYKGRSVELNTSVTTFDSVNWASSGQGILFNGAVGGGTDGSSFNIWVPNPAGTVLRKAVHWTGTGYSSGGDQIGLSGHCGNSFTTALTGIRIFISGGTITSGVFKLYGLQDS